MAKELPYFKFYINEWVNGDITLEDYELQGIFINVCGYYWSKDCDLSLLNLNKKFRGFEDKIKQLIDSKIIKVIGENVAISFLNEQLESKEVQIVTNRINGAKGGRPKTVKTEEKPNGLIFANRNLTESITETKAKDNPNITNIEKSRVEKSKEDNIKELFEIFWSKYPVKVSKANCLTKFKNLSDKQRDKIASTIDQYIKHKPFATYNHPNPLTYLNQSRFDDDLTVQPQLPLKSKLQY